MTELSKKDKQGGNKQSRNGKVRKDLCRNNKGIDDDVHKQIVTS